MAKIKVDIGEVMASPDLTLSSSPFAPGKTILKRVPYKGKGNVPPWLRPYLIKPGECKGQTGKVTYGGKVIPRAAACIAERHRK